MLLIPLTRFAVAVAGLCLSCSVLALEATPKKPRSGTAPIAEIIDLNPQIAPSSIAEILEPDAVPPATGDPSLPRAAISADGQIAQNCWLLLDGSASTDPLGETLEYSWRQSAGPIIPFTDAELKQPKLWICLSQFGDYRFALRVKNAKGISPPSERKFAVRPGRVPLPERDARRTVGAGERCALPGEGWTQVAGASVDLQQAGGVSYFRPGRAGLYLFEAPRAGDAPERRGFTVPPGLDGTLGNRRPIAKIAHQALGHVGKPLTLNASLSFDPDGAAETQPLKAIWKTAEKYRGVELEPLPNLRAKFKAPRPGVYSVLLSVTDGKLESQPPEPIFIQIDMPTDEAIAEGREFVDEEAPGTAGDDVRFRKVTLGLWGNLERAVQLFPSRCGVALRVDADFAPVEKFVEIPLALEARDGALMHLIDGIARQTDARYRRDKDRAFWLTTPLAWVKEEKLAAVAVLVDALYTKPDASDLLSLLMPAFKPVIDARASSSLEFEKSRQEIHGILPASAAARLKEIFAALRVPDSNGLPPTDLPSGYEYRLQKALGETRVTFSKQRERLDFILRDLGQQAGVSMAFDPRQFKDIPRLDIDLKNVPLRDAARTLVELAGFDGCSVESPGGLWFYRGSRPYPTSELLWDHTLVRAYDMSKLLSRVSPASGQPLSGETIAYIIQRRIYPASWKDPGALIFYHPQTRKLLVMHGPAAHKKILEFLYDLGERGEWALGPVEEATKK